MIRLGAQGWELHRGPACNGCTPVPGLRGCGVGSVFVGDGAHEAVTKKRKQDTLKILRERASRLLRTDRAA